MVSKRKDKRKPQGARSRSPARSAKPHITLETPKAPSPVREQLLKRLNLKPSDVLSERDIGRDVIFVTKNGMKVRVKK